MRRILKLSRDSNYYFGLLLLVGASLSLIWAIWRDAFEPENFLVYFLIYGWGYLLLLKSDVEYRFGRLEQEMTRILSRIDSLEKSPAESEPRYLTAPAHHERLEAGNETPAAGEIFQELWGENSDPNGEEER